ncbi:fungal-specific transcription factor domain-containing protein [Microdochium trichocladiopsis]|uniref:Fungal-specific transcription factor domain-containing protein n=1 Tax=Microdochium trichocladiopsis TaxID=1682393 RepID=A0A9P8YKF0_9PEZI|nr:fungal-specific transcription factor domain-containing protein [Microdochium trichocladiopsis]KAH7041523.1 fungal-specific transcription factor domain-containing protein [Microdochium trichocladiopsis]
MAQPGSRGCWTCRDRRVRCDRTLPHCRACARSKRQCQGYGLRLSWPRERDPKRFIVGPAPVTSTKSRWRPGVGDTSGGDDEGCASFQSNKSYWFVHTGAEDVEVYHDLVASRSDLHSWQRFVRLQWPRFPLNSPLIWSSLELGDLGKPLMQYFYTIAYTAIPTFSAYSTTIRGLLVRMAFSNNGLPAQALRYGMLALASVHRNEDVSISMRYKGLALRALANSTDEVARSAGEAARHVAAVMLLSSLYMQACFMTGNEWISYLAGARELTKKSRFALMVHDSDDISELMDWVYHQDVFSRFSSFHWRRGYGNPHRRLDEVPEYQPYAHPLQAPKPNRKILSLFHDVFDAMKYQPLTASGMGLTQDEELARLLDLQEQVRNAKYVEQCPPRSGTLDVMETEDELARRDLVDMPAVFELYRLAALTCLARTGESRFGLPAKIDGLLEDALGIMRRMETCQRQFPVLVLGTQAKTEPQRRAVVDLLDRTTDALTGRTMACLKRSVEVSWVQMDLHADQDLILDFSQLMRTLCGNCSSVPNLA